MESIRLYVGKVKEEASKQDTEDVVRRHFSEFGDIYRRSSFFFPFFFLLTTFLAHSLKKKVNVLAGRGVAFVTYTYEINAQFAKEAMSHQSLDSDEILNVRWATEDPNPGQIKREQRRVESEGREAIRGKVDPGQAEAEVVLMALESGEDDGLYLLPDEEEDHPVDEAEDLSGKRKREEGEGLLDRDALEGMKYFLEIKRRKEEDEKKVVAKPAAATGLGLLGGYGSDEESD